jgi:hypothetical protein
VSIIFSAKLSRGSETAHHFKNKALANGRLRQNNLLTKGETKCNTIQQRKKIHQQKTALLIATPALPKTRGTEIKVACSVCF